MVRSDNSWAENMQAAIEDQNVGLKGIGREKPRNGIEGLKHIKHDVLSGVVVSLVSLPLSSGIAIASGVPPIYGLISAIIAGLIYPFIGGSYVTIAGPAAGLAPALFYIMGTLGGAGNADKIGNGYAFLLCIIFMVGIVQIILAGLKLAKYASMIPFSVVEGMLASIGLMIIVKQVPTFFGFTAPVEAHEFYEFVVGIPAFAMGMTPAVFAVSFATMIVLFVLDAFKDAKLFKVIPPQLWAVVFGVVAGQLVGLGNMNPKFLISIPSNLLAHGIHMPDFAELLLRRDLWYYTILGVVTLTMIDGVESLATAMAIDRIDPFKRKSQPNRVLLAMGVCNIASSLVGGLTIIPGGVKSKANIASGGRTLWANFTNAICLILYIVFASSLISMIPRGVLASVLIYTGWKMCEPIVWRHMAHIGKEQLAVFTFTVIATLATDLLIGILAGTLMKLIINVVLYKSSESLRTDGTRTGVLKVVKGFFQNPVGKREMVGDELHLHMDKPLVCFNSMKLTDEFEKISAGTRSITIHLNDKVRLIDHTSCENLLQSVDSFSENNLPIHVLGLNKLRARSHYPAAARVEVELAGA